MYHLDSSKFLNTLIKYCFYVIITKFYTMPKYNIYEIIGTTLIVQYNNVLKIAVISVYFLMLFKQVVCFDKEYTLFNTIINKRLHKNVENYLHNSFTCFVFLYIYFIENI